MTDHVTLRLHTGGLYLTNYVTSEGNWLHQILFRGFIAKGGEYICTHHFSVFTCLKKNIYIIIFFFISLHQFGLFCVCLIHEIQFMVLMKQNRKNTKGGEYFCKALYIGDRTILPLQVLLRIDRIIR